MTQKELQSKNVKELHKIVQDLKAKLFMLRFQNSTGQLDKTHQIRLVRKDISRILTIISSRKKIIKKPKSFNNKNDNLIVKSEKLVQTPKQKDTIEKVVKQ